MDNETCEECGGEGVVDCPECDGSGTVECDDCNGEGEVYTGNDAS